MFGPDYGADFGASLADLMTHAGSAEDIMASLVGVLGEPAKFRLLLQDFSLDRATFYGRYGCTQDSFLRKTERLLVDQPDGARDGTLSMVLLFGRSIEISSRYSSGGLEPGPADIDLLQQILRGAANFPDVLRSVYDFGGLASVQSGYQGSETVSIAWETLDLHRLGTTSIIFSVYTSGLQSQKLALKVSHVLFTTIGPIASATSSYHTQWQGLSRACPFTPRIIASGTGWIIEDFIVGPTLREFVRAHAQTVEPLDLTLMVFPPIVEALRSFHLANHGHGHGDLNPANIIIQKRAAAPPEISAHDSQYEYVAYLIDMGRNLLASDVIGRVRSADTAFVAPEVRRMTPNELSVDRSADFFSLGHILAFCLGYEESDGFYYLDERLFRDQPMPARMACGLVNNRPIDRMLYVRTLAKRGELLPSGELDVLARYSVALIGMLKEITDESLTSADSALRVLGQGVFGSWKAVGIALRQLVRTWRRRDQLPTLEMAGSARIVTSAFTYLFGMTLVGYVLLLEAHRDPLGLAGLFGGLGFHLHDGLYNIELAMVGGSFFVASFQYNIVVYGGISFLHTSANRVVRVLSETWLWIVTVTVLACVATAFFVNPQLWILVSACGQTMVNINNILARLARRDIDRQLRAESEELAWYKDSVIIRQGFDILRYWTPTYIAYTIFLFALAILAGFGQVHDYIIWASAITFLNIFVLSYSQATQQGPILRGNLSQYAMAGENFRLGSTAKTPVHAMGLDTVPPPRDAVDRAN